ncbi:MAG: RNA polymerase sigma factor [Actinomycetota bacterium]
MSPYPTTHPPTLHSCVQRDVVALRIVLGYDTAQTAQVLGIAEGTVTAHLFRALNRLEQEVSGVAPKEAWT